MKKSCHLGKADFIAFIEVEKLMIKRKWSLRHIILLYTRFGMATRRVRGLSHALLRHKEISDSILRYADPSSLAQFLAPLIRREWKRLVHNHDQPFSKARDSNPSGLLDVKHLFEYIRQAVLTSRLDQIQSLACCRSRYTATPHRGGQNTATHMR